MKNLLILCSLLAIGLSTPSFAQDADTVNDTSENVLNVKELSEGGVKVNIDFDEEISADQKIRKVTDLMGEFDPELGRELETELNALSDDEKQRLVEKLDDGFTFDPGVDNFPIGIVFIAVPAVLLIFGMPLFLLIALLVAGHRKRRQKMELVDLYIKSDRDIPEHVMTGLDNGGSASSLKSGLTLTAVGIGIVAALSASGGDEAAGFGLIPMFLGIARLVFWFLVERKVEQKPESNS